MVRFFTDFKEYPFYQEYLMLLDLVFGWKASEVTAAPDCVLHCCEKYVRIAP